MDIFLSILAVLCGIVGIIGSVIPVLPGPMLSFLGMLCCSWTDFSTLSSNRLWTWGIITIIVSILDFFLPGYFSKLMGGTRAGITGATIGVFVGLFLGPLGVILGPLVGAFLGELINNHENLDRAVTVGFGSLVSFLAGSGIKIIISGFMLYYIGRDIWHAIMA